MFQLREFPTCTALFYYVFTIFENFTSTLLRFNHQNRRGTGFPCLCERSPRGFPCYFCALTHEGNNDTWTLVAPHTRTANDGSDGHAACRSCHSESTCSREFAECALTEALAILRSSGGLRQVSPRRKPLANRRPLGLWNLKQTGNRKEFIWKLLVLQIFIVTL